jgi:hypothetical protein
MYSHLIPKCPRQTKEGLHHNLYTNVHSTFVYRSKSWKWFKCPSIRSMEKQFVIYLYNGILVNNKKKWSIPICANVDNLKIITLSERSQSIIKNKCICCTISFLPNPKQSSRREPIRDCWARMGGKITKGNNKNYEWWW